MYSASRRRPFDRVQCEVLCKMYIVWEPLCDSHASHTGVAARWCGRSKKTSSQLGAASGRLHLGTRLSRKRRTYIHDTRPH